jgi:hypothetical protein
MEDERLVPVMDDVQAQELEIVTYLLKVFQGIPQASRRRVIETVSHLFSLGGVQNQRHPEQFVGQRVSPEHDETPSTNTGFSEDRTISPKQFMFQKQPKTDIEKVICLAYYLTHYRDTPHFKTLDISKLNTEAAQIKFSNPAVAVDNATKAHLLVPATKGNKQISSLGEQFVLVLPDRDRAREVLSQHRPRKRLVRRDPLNA